MKLLVITQKVDQNDAILGFFVAWLNKLAEVFEEIKVITLFKGEYHLPKNVEVFSLGKEQGLGRLRRFLRFYKLAKELLPKTDAVLAHMCPEYIVAINFLNQKHQKPLFLWYTHKSVSKYLISAEKLVKKIFTASAESCRVQSDKIIVTGHGIDVDYFKPGAKSIKDFFEIITVGRMAPVKNLEFLIDAVSRLSVREKIKVKLIGEPLLDQDIKYQDELASLVTGCRLHDVVDFTGPIPYQKLLLYYQNADLFVNLSKTGSIDKAVLEAMSCNLPILTANEAFKGLLPEQFLVKQDDVDGLAKKIEQFYKNPPTVNLRQLVSEHHDLTKLIKHIAAEIKNYV